MTYSGLIFASIVYVAYIALFIRLIWRVLLLLKVSNLHTIRNEMPAKTSVKVSVKGLFDIIFLTRLLKNNEWLWLGEWLFHISFLMVVIRHLRYFIVPVPNWLMNFNIAGICASYIFLFALIYIMVFKIVIEKKYLSIYNFFLLILLLLIAVSGFLMKNFIRVDVVNIKIFMLGVFSFKILEPPVSIFFLFHLIMSLIFLIFLPVHIIVAPYTLMESRKQEEYLKGLMNGK